MRMALRGPPDKRRRLSSRPEGREAGGDFWDEEEEDNFTADQLDEFDFLASQALETDVKPIATSTQIPEKIAKIAAHGQIVNPGATSNAAINSIASEGYQSLQLDATTSLFQMPKPVDSCGKSSDVIASRMQKMKEQLESYKKQVTDLNQQQVSMQGQISILKTTLQERDHELNKQRREKVELLDQKAKEQSEKEKQLASQVDRFKTQLEFRDQEMLETKRAYKKLESRIRTMEGITPDSQHRTNGAHIVSPKSKRESSPAKAAVSPKSPFPSRNTFLANVSPETKGTPRQAATTPTKSAVDLKKNTKRKPRMRLSVASSAGNISGPELVGQLLQSKLTMSQEEHGGLVNILQSCDLKPATMLPLLERLGHKTALSPVSDKRLQQLMKSKADEPALVPSQRLYRQQHAMARQGLDLLLKPGNLGPNSQEEGVLLLLPLLEAYISHYQEMLTVSALSDITADSKRSAGIKADTLESPESYSSSLQGYMDEGARDANDIEGQAACALDLLHTLVQHSQAVRAVICDNNPDINTTQRPNTQQQYNRSTKPAASSSSTAPSSSTQLKNQHGTDRCNTKSNLLNKLFSLAKPVTSNVQYNHSGITVTSLQILHVLVLHCPPSLINRFESLLVQETLHKCLSWDVDFRVVTTSLDILTLLAAEPGKHKPLCSYTTDDKCIYLSLYMLAAAVHDTAPTSHRTTLHSKIIQFLSVLTSSKKDGVNQFLETDCANNCSLKCVQSLILMLHQELQIYKDTSSLTSLAVLQQGLVLLHTLSMHDHLFSRHTHHVEFHFVDLMYGLELIFKEKSDFDNEVAAIQDLMDSD